MTQQFEYVAVKLPTGSAGKGWDRSLTAALNEVAIHGWRLHTVGQDSTAFAIFERPKQ